MFCVTARCVLEGLCFCGAVGFSRWRVGVVVVVVLVRVCVVQSLVVARATH